ncbi:TraK family protein [Methylobacter psychrophilus]|uniref:TraK family protein n=1 Tax=Methylobacter psychrophilus TaxID=96941 RepID=UPI0021D4AC3F|nr:TraK family protein [Methylobacter psychrophilus]
MSKKLTELIAEEETKRKQKGTGIKNRAVFLVLREDIKEAMTDGWALKQIYRTLHTQKKITFSYQTFVNYANNLILKPKQSLITNKQESNNKPHEQEQTVPTTEPITKKSHELPGFTFDPIAKKEDLI